MHVDLVVPAYNEAGNLRRTVDRAVTVLRDEADDWSFGILLVVSDGSTDGTQALAADLAAEFPEVSRLVRTENFGFGNAVAAGLAHTDGDVAIPFMADLSDDPADVPRLVEAVRDGYDVVYGSRFVEGGSVEGYPQLKLFYNRAFNNAVRLLFGIAEKDVTNAFTAYRREVIDDIDVETLRSDGFDVTAELPLRATVEGFRSTEVPVSWRSREAGVSKLNATRKGPDYAWRVLAEFVRGNVTGLTDLFGAVTSLGAPRLVVATLAGVALLVGLFTVTGFTEVYGVLTGANPLFVGSVALVYSVSFVFRTWRWRVLLRSSGHLAGRANSFRAIMSGWLFNAVIPARVGDLIRGYALTATEETPFSVAVGTIVVERVLDMLVLGLLMTVVAVLFVTSTRTTYLAAGTFLVGFVLLGGLVAAYALGDRLSAVLGDYVDGVEESVQVGRRALAQMADNPFGIALAALVSLPVWLSEIATVYVAARAVGVRLGVVPTVAAGISAFVSQVVPLTPGGLGTYETAITTVLVLFEVESATGTAIALVDHATRLAVVFVVGSVATVHLVFQSRPYFRERRHADDLEDGTERSSSK